MSIQTIVQNNKKYLYIIGAVLLLLLLAYFRGLSVGKNSCESITTVKVEYVTIHDTVTITGKQGNLPVISKVKNVTVEDLPANVVFDTTKTSNSSLPSEITVITPINDKGVTKYDTAKISKLYTYTGVKASEFCKVGYTVETFGPLQDISLSFDCSMPKETKTIVNKRKNTLGFMPHVAYEFPDNKMKIGAGVSYNKFLIGYQYGLKDKSHTIFIGSTYFF